MYTVVRKSGQKTINPETIKKKDCDVSIKETINFFIASEVYTQVITCTIGPTKVVHD